MLSFPQGAYDLGFHVCRVRYCMLYMWWYGEVHRRFIVPEDPETSLRESQQRLEESVSTLNNCMDTTAATQIQGDLNDLRYRADRVAESYRDGRPFEGQPAGYGVCPGQPQWRRFLARTRACLRPAPRLEKWRRLGEAIGSCWLSMVDATHEAPRPDLEPIMTAAAALPESARQTVPILQRCAALAGQQQSDDALLAQLCEAEGLDPPSSTIAQASAVSIMSKPLTKLDDLIV